MRVSRSLGVVLLGAVLAAVPASAASLTRQPYLNSVSQTSAIVAFRLDQSCAATVRYAPAGGGAEQAANSSGATTRHAIKLDGLQPGTDYTYRLEACGAPVGTQKTFGTAPGPQDQTIHFAAVGDIGSGSSDVPKVHEQIRAANAEFYVTLGDNAYDVGSESDYQTRFFEPLGPMLAEVPIFPTLGNHEYGSTNAQPHIDNFWSPTNNPRGSERYYSFDWGFVHVAVLDSSCDSSSTCTRSEQATWLANDLASSQAAWKFVLVHHPPWSSGEHLSAVSVRDAFGPAIEKYGVDLVLTGHDHNYERSKPLKGTAVQPAWAPGSPLYLVVGTGGAGLRSFPGSQPAWSAFRSNQSKGYLDVSINGGTLTGKWIGTGGAVLDSFTLSKQVAPPAGGGGGTVPGTGGVTLTTESARGPAPFVARLHAEAPFTNATFAWDFGDGTTGTGASVSHTYATAGSYSVRVRATGDNGSGEATAQLTADPPGSTPPGPTPPPLAPPPGGGDAGGGGCSAAGGALILPFALIPLLLRRRRRG